MPGPNEEANASANHDDCVERDLCACPVRAFLASLNISAGFAFEKPEKSPDRQSQETDSQGHCHLRWGADVREQPEQKDEKPHASKHKATAKITTTERRQGIWYSKDGWCGVHAS